jgi:hypothetical protein
VCPALGVENTWCPRPPAGTIRRPGVLHGVSAFPCSAWANNGKVFCLSEDGDTFVIQAGPEFKVLGCNRPQEMCLATPAAVGGRLPIRTLSKLYRIGDQ